MEYTIEVVEVEATILASVRRRVAWTAIPVSIKAQLDAVYAFLDGAGIAARGQNVCIYHRPAEEDVELEAGVQIGERFEATGEVRCSETPGGRAARTMHRGAYDRLGDAADALIAWCTEHSPGAPGPCWEVYGDWAEDPELTETTVYLLLERR